MAIQFGERTIKYLNKDFESFKRDLIEHTKAHQSGSFQDFNESSPGMALLELTAYIGDVLSFYQDRQFDELRRDSAKHIRNVDEFARMVGYKSVGKRAATAVETVFVEVPATVTSGSISPDFTYAPILRAGSKFQGPGTVFESLSDIDFSAESPTENTTASLIYTGSRFDSNNVPTHFALRKDVVVIAGETITENIAVGSFEKFRRVNLSTPDVVEIISVVDSDGNDWVEVEYLPQSMVFDSLPNESDDVSLVPNVLRLKPAPRRFVTRRDPITNFMTLIFGSGDGINFDDELIPDISEYSLPTTKTSFSPFSIDPQNFLRTRTLGLCPFNTTLTVTYRVGGGENTNVSAGSIKSIHTALTDFRYTGLSNTLVSAVEGSFECINVKKSENGGDEDTIEDIKANSSAVASSQSRMVTAPDFIGRLMSLPSKFGRIDKAFVQKNSLNTLSVNVHVLSKDEDGHFSQVTKTLQKNIKTYLSAFRMLTDIVNLLHTDIVNLRVDFGVVVNPLMNKSEVLAKCLSNIRDHLDNSRMYIMKPIVLSELSAKLQETLGVISVFKLSIKSISGEEGALSYIDNSGKSVSFDVEANTRNGILYCPEGSIFQIKFPNVDITGEAK